MFCGLHTEANQRSLFHSPNESIGRVMCFVYCMQKPIKGLYFYPRLIPLDECCELCVNANQRSLFHTQNECCLLLIAQEILTLELITFYYVDRTAIMLKWFKPSSVGVGNVGWFETSLSVIIRFHFSRHTSSDTVRCK